MTARDTIAAAHHAEISRRSGELPAWRDLPQSVRDYYLSSADAVIAAVRSMPVEDQAELIGAAVNRDRDLSTNRRIARVVGIWRDEE